ncbi:MAG: CoA transferase [Pseudomonadales bacterium]|jgi:crotonobetainyl-CoA:carnitine CoA-transferase CaiB-like acyl-CoA transferase|nr:CoA transferase [Pseudomonadales bacterium]MDP7357721.1 CoA transferase [Pseudomonadales bacterium]MDP7596166.1 CoA transferase [Pseudomonadales bacterium]HJN50423.1 CoA transferase [Pseudomonadales bacterium]|tara:strand:- start:1680 stop:2936 length:1257 start_codon:yes stop_codon:yes gene_type:complete
MINEPQNPAGPLANIRVCDFSGILAGAGATKFLAAFGAEVIRIEDPVRQGRWDMIRGRPPYVDERSGINLGGGWNNHNVGKLGVTINLKHERGKALAWRLIETCSVLTENFAAGVLDRLGFSYQAVTRVRPEMIYATNCGFGHTGPYSTYKSMGPIAQAASGLTFASGLPDQEPAGYGYSYMDHTAAYYMAMAIMMAIHYRNRTGEGQYVDVAATEAGAVLHGAAVLDYTVNRRPQRRHGMPDANHSHSPAMAPHNIYPCIGDDNWIAIACRNDVDWLALKNEVGTSWVNDAGFDTLTERLARETELDALMASWTQGFDKIELSDRLQSAALPAAPVRKPGERIDGDANTSDWGLWPSVQHTEMGEVRVDGIPAHLSKTDWQMRKASPCLGEDNDYVFGELLGLSDRDIDALREDGAI